MENPLVSIIVPVFGVEKYLNRCVESIVNQTYKNLEIILVDDGSPDNCPKMCDEWAKKDERIKVIHKENNGLAEARNSGLKVFSGDYVMFIDSDDYIDNDMVEFLLKLLLNNNADVSRCGFYYNYEAENEESTPPLDNSLRVLEYDERMIDLLSGTHVSGVAWNKLFKAEIVKSHRFKKTDGCSEDIMFNFRAYQDIKTGAFCDEPKYHYVIRENSITSSNFGKGAFSIITAKENILKELTGNEKLYPYAVKSFVKSLFVVLSGCIQNSAFDDKKNEIIELLLSYKNTIQNSNMYSKKDKYKIYVLSVSPRLYEKIVLWKHIK